ncbi:membrane metallo-endopeptidase-like 1 [Monomorium pharaonis]|uniref:membrane metallo-endopeptidase-like 1 n=1 Tax=Monomorium pharaonis TaxID=307658 RepID=UPI00063FB11F|nr:membrane metallo-endopeptidase-like 1 [Monomorium pharaonis]
MRRFILIAFIGTFLTRDVMLSKVHQYPSSLAWLFGSNKLNDNEEKKRTVCESEDCKKMANMMLGSMNKSVNPCDDFYEYACGRWSEQNPIPEGYREWSVLYILQFNKTDKQVQDIVEEELKEDDLRAVKLAKNWYKACMDTDAIEKQGIDPLVSTLTRLGGWPMIMEPNQWDEEEYSWQKVDDQYMRLTGRNAFYDVRISKDSDNPKVVEIDTPHLPPGSKTLRSIMKSDKEDSNEKGDEEQSKSEEDPSDEEEQSNEVHEPGSEDKDDFKFVDSDSDDYDDSDDDDYNDSDNDDDDNDNDDSDDDDKNGSGDSDNDDEDSSGDDNDNDDENGSGSCDNNDDNDNDINEQHEDFKEEMEKITRKKITKIVHKRNKKLQSVGQINGRIIQKHDNHKRNKEKIKREAEVDNKHPHRFTRRKKLHVRKDNRRKNHVRKVHMKKIKNLSAKDTTAISQVTTEKGKKITLLRQYADHISHVAHIIAKEKGTKISQERLDKDVQDMIKFQLKLIQIIPTESIFNLLFNLEVTLREFQEWYDEKEPKTAKSKIDWVNKIKALFDEAYESVNDDLNLNIVLPNYIEELVSLLDETSNRTIVNYIHWNFISRIIKTTTSDMTNLYNTWKIFSTGEVPRERSEICTESTEIKNILAYEFVRRYFSDDKMKTASNMISDIQKAVEDLIKKSNWMNNKAKNFALAKVKNLKRFIGYPNWYKNTTIIQEYFKELVIGSSYYENTLRYNRYVKLKSLRKLSDNNNEIQFFDETDPESLNPVEVNAFYMPWLNALAVTAADFQSPWYADGRPQSVNFGTMGFIIAHEINHGFDNTGYKFDKDGEFLGWFSSMADSYDKKEDCFVEQFNNYPIDKKTNEKIKNYGSKTTGDNIADTMGLQAIFKAYQRKQKERETPDAALPDMEDFTNNQLFFLSFANLWCEAIDPNQLMDVAKEDVHSIGRLRVIGSVSNSDDFATAYNCPVGSPMNPEKKCNIWN